MQQLRQSAVQRILGATKNKPIRNFRELLLSRLVSQAPQADGLSDLMLQHVLGDYNANRGHLLVVRWLYALAAALAAQRVDGSAPAAAAGAGAADEATAVAGDDVSAAAAAAADMEGVEREAGAAEQAPDGEQQQQASTEQEGVGVDVDMQEAAAEGRDGSATHAQQQQQQQQLDRQQAAQHSSGRGSSSSSRDTAQDLSDTQYESVLLSVLQGLQQQLPSSDPAIQRLLQDAPVLPLNATLHFLQQLMEQGSGWSVLALDSAHALMEGRPPMRQQLLQLVLQASVSDDSAMREHAVRLLVSQLMGWESFADGIVEFAQAQLLLLLEPRKLLAARQQVKQEQQQQQANDAAGGAAADDQQQQQQRVEEPISREQQDEQQQQQGEQQQALKQEDATAEDPQQQQQDAEPELDVDVAAQHCMLFMSLCASRPELLAVLLNTYGKAGKGALPLFIADLCDFHRAVASRPELLGVLLDTYGKAGEMCSCCLKLVLDLSLCQQLLAGWV
jgi:hypothetical protein